MPIYEYYCRDCNTVFSFFSKKVNTEARPLCPACHKKKLEKLLSAFAVIGNAEERSGLDQGLLDESKMEKAVSSIAGEVDRMDENDPKQAAKLMRKFADMSGMELGGSMKDAIDRLEAGDDPEKIEAEMGDIADGNEQPFLMPGDRRRGNRAARPQPRRDSQLYEM